MVRYLWDCGLTSQPVTSWANFKTILNELCTEIIWGCLYETQMLWIIFYTCLGADLRNRYEIPRLVKLMNEILKWATSRWIWLIGFKYNNGMTIWWTDIHIQLNVYMIYVYVKFVYLGYIYIVLLGVHLIEIYDLMDISYLRKFRLWYLVLWNSRIFEVMDS